jgi:WD40-like Beta Propeller Repeat
MFAGAPQGDGPSRIFVVDPQGRQVSSFQGWLPSWSPDSSRVAAWDDPSETVGIETVGIWSVDGGRVSTVPFPTGVTLPGDSTPTFTGDGQALYFVLSRVSSEPEASRSMDRRPMS